ncbi:hypothetical protein [Amycolatopsis japonica]
MTIEPLDTLGRWWRVNGHEIDLQSTADQYPHRAAVLAHRDGADDEGRDVSAILAAAIDTGSPLDGLGHLVVTGWLFTQSQRLVDRVRTRLAHLEGEDRERAA